MKKGCVTLEICMQTGDVFLITEKEVQHIVRTSTFSIINWTRMQHVVTEQMVMRSSLRANINEDQHKERVCKLNLNSINL